ncbi:hypothetical protein HanRHA438_Chr16g0764071 [Helianthus annuus]|uniref:Uncharacterized protein n=1 Tax=Helianthus annuus TaxID=4232 RepID=A0A251V040_HELAN|nr:hypothetical protein HanXRQr2_Chr16g0752221 [Helianthus annuus]KAJ0438394.1 hypothetical protein HanHA300_Chr16g0613511 [Helianthus annuus]KAJ0443130.1 hypothetical protein HanIR_Chr16g0817351 [Helianthus annuus]KAJ0460719.1 hypothetical protein HanHA89_Chr16g0664101 [Helianthus annuus]KAJ0645051.1 hypothetical protein HanOQP8_Chr16g0619511 [Helianthus annuus]
MAWFTLPDLHLHHKTIILPPYNHPPPPPSSRLPPLSPPRLPLAVSSTLGLWENWVVPNLCCRCSPELV